MTSGIYIIKNTKNNKVYVGSSVNIKHREYKHFWMLGHGSHDNSYLQSSYKKYGKDSFIFEILEMCDEHSLVERENYYISKYNSNFMSFGYNLATVSDLRRNHLNNEVKVKLSKNNLIKNKNFSSFSLTNIETMEIFIFESLVEGANYLIENGFTFGSPRNVRMKLSNCLRGVKLDNGYHGTIRKTCYKHIFKIIN
jgi:hypothetical protein